MDRKTFLAKNWLIGNDQNSDQYIEADLSKSIPEELNSNQLSSVFTPFIKEPEQNKNSEFGKFFTPGWSGGSLVSREVKILNNIMDKIKKDVYLKLKRTPSFSRKVQIAIFDEFISFSEFSAENCSEVNHMNDFWMHMNNSNSPYADTIERFLQIFSFRISVIYLLKVRFILTLIENDSIEFNIKNILYPNSFITSVFRKGGKYSLDIKAFEQNVFSWYQPDPTLKDSLLQFKNIYKKIGIHELIKNIATKSEDLMKQKSSYSHTISHKQFGLFLNSLLINFPVWLRSFQGHGYCPHLSSNKLEMISCHYSGDYLESISLSHWLAQNNNKDIKWNQVLCPDFLENSFDNGSYLSLFNELQFITFLAKISTIQGHNAKEFVCDIFNTNKLNKKKSEKVQTSFTMLDESLQSETFDRVIVNLAKSPKSNPQHHLIQSIQQQKELINSQGYLFILSNKKLFVASQKQKLESLLKDLKVESVITLDNVKGKGEVPSYIYILSKVDPLLNKQSKKQTCFNFRLNSDLHSFQDFSQITSLINIFMEKFLGDPPPMHQKRLKESKLEFFQDAIMDGRLIHSSNKDSSKITHPLFFEKMMKICRPLDYFFEFHQINFKPNARQDDHVLEINEPQPNSNNNELVFIVNQREQNKTRIEVIPSSTLESKSYEYGHSDCFYFNAYSKWPNLHIQSIKEYLQSSIGVQIIDLTFNNEQRKIKRNLSKLLLPIFFAQNENVPEHISKGVELLSATPKDLLAKHPKDLSREFKKVDIILNTIVKDYPGQIIGLLTQFKLNIAHCKDRLCGQNNKGLINFSNPIVKSPLLMTKKYPIYPDNKEVYISFHNNDISQLHSSLTKITIENEDNEGEKDYFLNLYSENDLIVSLYSTEEMIHFLKFLLDQVPAVPISAVLQGISIPKISELKDILESSKSIQEAFDNISLEIPLIYNRLINSIISQQV